MDILNFISWIKSSKYRSTIPTDVPSLLVIGAKDPKRDDAWLSLALNADGLKPLYNKGTVTQLGSTATAVTLNASSGVITTFQQTLATGSKSIFTVNNSVVTASSVILVSAQYGSAAAPLVYVSSISAGAFEITITNPLPSLAMNALVKVHFFIVA